MNEIQAGLESFFNELLELTSFFILPNWNDVIQHMLPAAVVLFLVGPILTLLVLYWLYQWVHMPRFHVRPAEVVPVPVPRDEAGQPVIPASVPYCSFDGLLYPGPRDALHRMPPGAQRALPGRRHAAQRDGTDLHHLRHPIRPWCV